MHISSIRAGLSLRNPAGIILLLAITTLAHAQVDSLWSRTYGGTGSDISRVIYSLSDGNLVMAGETNSFGNGSDDFYVIKSNGIGDIVWSRTFGGDGPEWCHDLVQIPDGMVFGGTTSSFGPGSAYNFWLLAVSSTGDSLWSRAYGGINQEECHAIKQCEDGGYVLAGYTDGFGAGQRDFWLLRTNAAGDSIWSRRYGGDWDEECYAISQTNDGGYILAGYSSSFSGDHFRHFWVVKTNEQGDSLWSRHLARGQEDWCRAVLQANDGGYVLGGHTATSGGAWDFWLVKMDSSNDSVLWSRTYGRSYRDAFYSMESTADGGYVLAGSTSIGPSHDAWLVKINVDGDSLWSRTFGGDSLDVCRSIKQTTDGNYVLAGYTRSFGAGGDDFWLLKTTPELAAEDFTLPPSSFSLSNYPNPFNSSTTISFELPRASRVLLNVFDITGRAVATLSNEMMYAGSHHINFDAATLPSGIYVYRLTSGNISQARKLVLLK